MAKRVFTQKQLEIQEIMRKYRDDRGVVDMTKLRNEDPGTYSIITYHFGSIQDAIDSLSDEQHESASMGGTMARQTLRNHLAFHHLKELRKNHTLDEIATKYGYSKVMVGKLEKELTMIFGPDEADHEKMSNVRLESVKKDEEKRA